MAESIADRRLGTAATAALLVAVGAISFVRAWHGEWDFSHFYHDARDVWERRELDPFFDPTGGDAGRRLPFYLPAVPALLAPLTAFGPTPAAAFWAAIQVAALGCSLHILRRRWIRSDAAYWLAVCLALPAIYEAAKFNQLSFPVLALILIAYDGMEQKRTFVPPLALGLAVVLKLLPGILVLWLCLKRRWMAAAMTLVAAALFATVPAVIAFGPVRAAAHYAEWWRYNIGGDSVRGLLGAERREHFTDHRNQSIVQVLARWTWAEHPHRIARQPLQLTAAAGRSLARIIAAALLLALLWFTRRAARSLDPGQLRMEWAAFAIAMLALSPLVRQYYLIWALPALALFASRAEQRRAGLAIAGLVVWTLGMMAWMWPGEAWGEAARRGGVHLIMLIALGIVLIVESRSATRERRS